MSEAGAPIPNGDPRCHCRVEKGDDAGEPEADAVVSVYSSCPLHGEATRAIMRKVTSTAG